MSKFQQFDIIKVGDGWEPNKYSYYKINRVTKSYYEVSLIPPKTNIWNTGKRAFIIYNTDKDKTFSLHKKDISSLLKNL